jgi:transposase
VPSDKIMVDKPNKSIIIFNMFIRVKTTPNSPKKAVQIVEAVRDGDHVKQRIIRHIGQAEHEKEIEKLKELAEYAKARMESEHQMSLWPPEEIAEMAIKIRRERKEDDTPLEVNLKKLREEQRTVVGIHEVYGKLYEEIGFDNAFLKRGNEVNSKALYNLIMARIANPTSKRRSVKDLSDDFGIEIPLQKVYRMMDKIDDKTIDRIQAIEYQATKSLFQEKIDVLFYDCTTLYFESFSEDELKQNGYSKDMKFNQPQVILALLATQEGMPIGYEVFPGASFEGHTLVSILKKLQKRYKLNQIVFVADAGMLNEDNLSLLEKEGFRYVVGARLKNVTNKIQKQILDKNIYKDREESKDSSSEERLAMIEQTKDRNLIVSYSKNRAEKDKYDREKAIEKLIKKLGKNKKDPKTFLNSYGYKKYLVIKGDTELTINQEKVNTESKWDGLHGVITNIKDMSPEAIVSHYRDLWQIEECFRISKHDLKIRPIYHWTPKRVKAHIAIVFIALSCIRHLTYRVKMQYDKLSPEAIRNALTHVQLSFVKDQWTKERYCIPSNITQEAKKIYQIMGIKLSLVPFKLI